MSTSRTLRASMLLALFVNVFIFLVYTYTPSVSSQSGDNLLNEHLDHLSLQHYEMDPRTYLESETGAAAPDTPTSPNYLPWTKVAYQSYRNDNWDIFVSNDNGSEVRLTTTGGDEIHPRLNRGGTRIAYAYAHSGDLELYAMNLDGSNKIQLTNNDTDDVNPYWSLDGTKIVFQAYRDGQPEIYVMNADGSGQTRLTNSGDYDGMPSWSPNGSSIAFVSRRTGGYRVYTMNTDGSNQTQRSEQPYSLEPVWSPDGTQIGYSADGDNNSWFEVWLMNANGSGQTQKYNPGNAIDAITRSWAPNGAYIAFTSVDYILYQGNWYWTASRLKGVGVPTGFIDLGPYTTLLRNWNPDWQTLDTVKPSSQVGVLASVSPYQFTVNWQGNDGGGAGIKSYDIQVRDGANGTWTNWQTGTAETAAAYTGVGGHTYYFRSRARDNSHNVEAWPANPDTYTMVEDSPPWVNMTTLPPYSRRQNLSVNWSGTDPGGSGIAGYDVQYRAGTGGTWTNLVTNTTATTASFNGTAGVTYYFRVRGRDLAQNVTPWPSGDGHTYTALYNWAINGLATNNAGAPVMGITTTTNPPAFANLPPNVTGAYGAYVATTASSYSTAWSKAGYGSLPVTPFGSAVDGSLNIVLPPADDVIQNGGFETGVFDPTDWTFSGTLPFTLTETEQHTGSYGAFLGEAPALTSPQLLQDAFGMSPMIVTGPDGVVHAAWNHNSDPRIYYGQRSNYGSWTTPQPVSPNTMSAGVSAMYPTSDGQLHMFFGGGEAGSVAGVFYMRRNTSGSWTTPVRISGTVSAFDAVYLMDSSGRGHAIFRDSTQFFYVRQNSNGTWTAPEMFMESYNNFYSMTLVKDSLGVIHLLWDEQQYGAAAATLRHIRRDPSGNWSEPAIIVNGNLQLSNVVADDNGNIHLMYILYSTTSGSLYYQKIVASTWYPAEMISTNAGDADFVLGDAGQIYAVWGTGNTTYYTEHNGITWSIPQPVYTAPASREPYGYYLELSNSGTLHLLWMNALYPSPYQVYYSRKPLQGEWEPGQYLGEASYVLERLNYLAVDKHNVPHMIWDKDDTGIYYASTALAVQAGTASLQQTVTVPTTQSVPTLSFLYWFEGASGSGGATFTVQAAQGGNSTTLLTTQSNTPGWQHTSINVSAYAGQTITLTMSLQQVANRPLSSVYVDEVSLGSTYPDVWATGDSLTAAPGDEVTYQIVYGNRGAAAANGSTLNHILPAGLTFVSASVAPTQINGSTLTWSLGTLAAHQGPITILITARIAAAATPFTTLTATVNVNTSSVELETLNNQAAVAIYLARFVYMPVVVK